MMVHSIHMKDAQSRESHFGRIPHDSEESILRLLWTPPLRDVVCAFISCFPLTSEGSLFGFHPQCSSRDNQ